MVDFKNQFLLRVEAKWSAQKWGAQSALVLGLGGQITQKRGVIVRGKTIKETNGRGINEINALVSFQCGIKSYSIS